MNKNIVRRAYKDQNGRTFIVNSLALPNADIFNMSIGTESGAHIERFLEEMRGKSVYGIAHLIEHMSFKSTRDYKTDELSETLKRFGIRNAGTSFDNVNYFHETTTENHDISINAVSNIFFNDLKRVTEEEFNSERKVVQGEIGRYKDNNQMMFSLGINSAIHKGSTADNILGTEDILEEITLEDMIEIKEYMLAHQHVYSVVFDPTKISEMTILDKILFERDRFDTSLDGLDKYETSYNQWERGIKTEDDDIVILENNSDRAIIAVIVDMVGSYYTTILVNNYLLELSNEASMFNVIRDKAGLTYGVKLGTGKYRTGLKYNFSADVEMSRGEELINKFKESVTLATDKFDEEIYKGLVDSLKLKNTLENADLRTHYNLFDLLNNYPEDHDALNEFLATDLDTAWINSVMKTATYEDVKAFLLAYKDNVINNKFITVTNHKDLTWES